MRAVVITKHGGPEVLEVQDRPDPAAPGPGEVAIDVEAAGTLEPWITPLRTLIADGTVQPVVAEALSFDRAADAHLMIAERRNVGKVVLVP